MAIDLVPTMPLNSSHVLPPYVQTTQYGTSSISPHQLSPSQTVTSITSTIPPIPIEPPKCFNLTLVWVCNLMGNFIITLVIC